LNNNIESLNSILHQNTYIIYVGNNEIKPEWRENPKIIIARELPNNIEQEVKLLTFTAWYLIIKNNLFESYEHICLMEYDLLLNETFKDDLSQICLENNPDVISFHKPYNYYFFQYDVSINVMSYFLQMKNINNSIINDMIWYASTNHCIRRKLLCDFVEWYYPDCLYIKHFDFANLSWYHERLFAVYLKSKNIEPFLLEGPEHQQLQSHYKDINNRIR
jgi:hypothetical protein